MTKTRTHQKYLLPDGREVPGVTTILSTLNKGEGLINWAWQLGRDGIDLRKAQSQAMDIGTLTHAMIEAHLKGETLDTSEYSRTQIDIAGIAFLAFLDWEKGQKLSTLTTEMQMVHPLLQYGGTADWVAKTPSGEHWLIDFKTSKNGACYPEYYYQIAAYKELYQNTHSESIKRCIILSLNKENGLPTPHLIEDTDKYFQIFDLCRQIYKLRREE